MAARSLLVVFALAASAVAAPIQQAAPRKLQLSERTATIYEQAVNIVLCSSIPGLSAVLGLLRSLLVGEDAPSCDAVPEPENRCDADFDGPVLKPNLHDSDHLVPTIWMKDDDDDERGRFFPKLNKWGSKNGAPIETELGGDITYKYHFCAGGHAYYYYADGDDGASARSFSSFDRTKYTDKPIYDDKDGWNKDVIRVHDDQVDTHFTNFPGGGIDDVAKYPPAEHTTAYYDCCCDDGTPGLCTAEEADALKGEESPRMGLEPVVHEPNTGDSPENTVKARLG